MSVLSKLSWSIVRPIITVLFAGTLVWGFVDGKIPAETFVPIAASAITWWYTSRDTTKPPTPPTNA